LPTNGQTLYNDTTVIAGRVGDMLSGFMGLNVWVTNVTLGSAGGPPAPFGGSPSGIVSPPNLPGGPPGTAGGPPALPAGGSANANVGIGNNGTYERGNVPLALGTNVHRRLAQPVTYGVARDAAKPTTSTGLVLDNTSHPRGLRPVSPSALQPLWGCAGCGLPRVGSARQSWAQG
jgi:hypothetical protein